MNSKVISASYAAAVNRGGFNPIKNLRPEVITRALDAFNRGRLSEAARLFEAIIQRDDTICCLNLKRKKSVSRLDFEIVPLENSRKARAHQKVLMRFYESLETTDFCDKNQSGGLRMLVSQMMDSAGMKYAVHRISQHLLRYQLL